MRAARKSEKSALGRKLFAILLGNARDALGALRAFDQKRAARRER
jgi:hypothetical protein